MKFKKAFISYFETAFSFKSSFVPIKNTNACGLTLSFAYFIQYSSCVKDFLSFKANTSKTADDPL